MIFPVTIKPYCQLKEESSQYIYRENQRLQGEPENGRGNPLSRKFGTFIWTYGSQEMINEIYKTHINTTKSDTSLTSLY